MGLPGRSYRIILSLQQQKRRLCFPYARQRALPPYVRWVLPRFPEIPSILPRRILSPIFAELVDHRGATHDRLEPRRLPLQKSGDRASIAITNQRHPLPVDRLSLQHRVHSCHNVTTVAAAQIVLIRRSKLRAIAAAAPRIRTQYRPPVSEEKVDKGRILIEIRT